MRIYFQEKCGVWHGNPVSTATSSPPYLMTGNKIFDNPQAKEDDHIIQVDYVSLSGKLGVFYVPRRFEA